MWKWEFGFLFFFFLVNWEFGFHSQETGDFSVPFLSFFLCFLFWRIKVCIFSWMLTSQYCCCCSHWHAWVFQWRGIMNDFLFLFTYGSEIYNYWIFTFAWVFLFEFCYLGVEILGYNSIWDLLTCYLRMLIWTGA